MTCFHDFSAPLWEIFTGNLLLLFCSLFYLVWWIIAFRPNSPGGTSGTPFIIAALAAGLLAVILLSIGISTLSNESKGLPVKFILLGGVVLFLVLLPVTSVVFTGV
ncbi:MAG: hypothetical protein HGA22_02905 [Clostridiales bacterium]|nr:hypothetical protein [Clostridiales bacterium]